MQENWTWDIFFFLLDTTRSPFYFKKKKSKWKKKLTLCRPRNIKVLEFVLLQLDVVLEQMHRAVAALRYVLQVCLRAAQLPRPRQAALQNFPVRDTLFAALLGFLIERFRHECRKFFHGRLCGSVVVLGQGEIHRELSVCTLPSLYSGCSRIRSFLEVGSGGR